MLDDEGPVPETMEELQIRNQELLDEVHSLRATNRSETARAEGLRLGLSEAAIARLSELPRERIREEAEFLAAARSGSPGVPSPAVPPSTDLNERLKAARSAGELDEIIRRERDAEMARRRAAAAAPDDPALSEAIRSTADPAALERLVEDRKRAAMTERKE